MISLFVFIFCFDILTSCLRIQQYSFLWRPPLRSFSPPHTHSSLSSSSSLSDSACDRPAREGFDCLSAWRAGNIMVGPGAGTLHSTGQLISVSGHMGAWRLQMTLFVFSSVLLTPLLAWYWWMMAVAFIRVVWFWSECSLCFHIYCNVTSRQRLYLKLREEGWKLFCRCIWDQTGLKTHNKY